MRNPEADPFGKLSERIEVLVSEPLKEGMSALAAARGMTVSEFARYLLNNHVFGGLSILRAMYRQDGPPTISGIPDKHPTRRRGLPE